MELTLAEELLLLALHDEKGSTGFTNVHPGLAGALLVDLGRLGLLRVEDRKIHPVSGRAPEHPVLAQAYRMITESAKQRTPKSWVGRLPSALKPFTETVAGPLVKLGILAEQRKKFLGVFPGVRFPEADPGPERELRARLRSVLLGQRTPTEDDALLMSLLVPLDLVKDLVEKEHRKDAKNRAKEIADGGIAGDAVTRVVQEIQTAVLAAVVVGAASGSDGGGGGSA